jgi:hypothetical protein
MAEIKLRDDAGPAGGPGSGAVGGPGSRSPEMHNRLAAALGLRALASHFKPIARNWGTQQQVREGHGGEVGGKG